MLNVQRAICHTLVCTIRRRRVLHHRFFQDIDHNDAMEVFKYLLVFVASLESFAHGANVMLSPLALSLLLDSA